MAHDSETTLRFVQAIMSPGTVIELRLISARFVAGGFIGKSDYNSTLSGWYDKPHDLMVDAARLKDVSGYVTSNPCNPDLLARSYNKVAKSQHATKAADILALRWLFLDIDPIRASGISATDAERALALGRRDAILSAYPGLAEASLTGSSGNGAFILARLDDLANDDAGRKLVADTLAIVAAQHDGNGVEIDQKTKDPSRIMALPGTMKCKGSNIPGRPWRLATLDALPEEGRTFDLAGFVAEHARTLPKATARAATTVLAPWSPGASDVPQRSFNDRLADVGEQGERIFRASRYLSSIAPAVSGQNGHNQTFDAACALVKGYDLPPADARPILAEWNLRCDPPWTDAELEHKLTEADDRPDDKPRGYLFRANKDGFQQATDIVLTGDGGLPATPDQPEAEEEFIYRAGFEDNPHHLARHYLRRRHNHQDGASIRFWRDMFFVWTEGAYRPITKPELKASISDVVSVYFDNVYHEQVRISAFSEDKSKQVKPIPVTTTLTANIDQAISGMVMLPTFKYPNQPCWLDGDAGWNPSEILPMRNAIVHLPSYLAGQPCTRKPTPKLFTSYCLQYDWQPDAPEPARWLAFLGQLWPDDPKSIEFLQEWFGLMLVPDTSFEKIAAFIGPPRAGKGVIASVMRAMIGPENCAGPTLSGLGMDFGLESLVGKLAAIIDDARLSGKADQAVITERLLSISGQGSLTINRKYLTGMELVLPCRITLISNEPPRLIDKSGALPNRFIILKFTRSFLGKEDPTLKGALQAELPGILLWAIEGWKRLKERGHFVSPESGRDVHEEMEDLASPIATFVRECCKVGDDETANKADLYRAWKSWCEENGKKEAGELSVFGRDLRTVIPTLKNAQQSQGGKRVTVYRGVGLQAPAEMFGSAPDITTPYTDVDDNPIPF